MLEEKVRRIEKWISGKKSPPWSLQIQVSNRCNLKCKFCCRNFEEIIDDKITDERLLSLVDEAYELDVKRIALNGRAGEPLMRKVSFQLMEKIKKYGIWGDLITNGTLFSSSIIEKLVKIGWDNIVFSIDSPNEKIHDYLRGRSFTFRKVMRNIKKINEWKAKLNTKKPTIKFLMVLTSLSSNKIVEMVKLVHKIKGVGVEIRPMIVHDRSDKSLDHLKLQPSQIDELKKCINKARILAKNLNIELILEHSLETLVTYAEKDHKKELLKKYEDVESLVIRHKSKKVRDLKCYFPFFEITIFPEGTASPCCTIWKQENRIKEKMVENVLEKTLKEIWYGECFKYYRRKILEGQLPIWCGNCHI